MPECYRYNECRTAGKWDDVSKVVKESPNRTKSPRGGIRSSSDGGVPIRRLVHRPPVVHKSDSHGRGDRDVLPKLLELSG